MITYFAWKDCQNAQKRVRCQKPAYVILPNDTVIEEPCYEGFGKFGGHNIFQMVADWNCLHLRDILSQMAPRMENSAMRELYELAISAVEGGALEQEAVDNVLRQNNRCGNPPDTICYTPDDWKALVGAVISYMNINGDKIPYPIKISSTRPRRSYAELHGSIPCVGRR